MIFVIVHDGSDNGIGHTPCIIMIAAPWVISGIVANSGMIGVEFDVSTTLKPMRLVFNENASIAAVPQVSFILVFQCVIMMVGDCEGFYCCCQEICPVRPGENMYVCVH